MTKLHQYLKDTGQTFQQFADRIGISRSYLADFATFKRTPNLRIAYDISVATGYLIPLEYWIAHEIDPETRLRTRKDAPPPIYEKETK